jgi:hypothetical protein
MNEGTSYLASSSREKSQKAGDDVGSVVCLWEYLLPLLSRVC